MTGSLTLLCLSSVLHAPAGGPAPGADGLPAEVPAALGRVLAVAPAEWHWIGTDEFDRVRVRPRRPGLRHPRVVVKYPALTPAQAARLKGVESPFGVALSDPPREVLAALAAAPGLRALALTFGTCPDWLPVGSSRVDLQACKLEYSIVSPK